MFQYKNKKGIMCIVDTSVNKEYRLSMPHEVVEVVALLNDAQQGAQRTVCTGCQNEVTEHDVYCPKCGLWNSTNRR